MVAEASYADIGWLEPRDVDPKEIAFRTDSVDLRDPLRRPRHQVSSPHDGRTNVLYCDGTVRGVDMETMKTIFEQACKRHK